MQAGVRVPCRTSSRLARVTPLLSCGPSPHRRGRASRAAQRRLSTGASRKGLCDFGALRAVIDHDPAVVTHQKMIPVQGMRNMIGPTASQSLRENECRIRRIRDIDECAPSG